MSQADLFWIFDNSGAELGLIGEGSESAARISSMAPKDLLEEVVAAWSAERSAEETET